MKRNMFLRLAGAAALFGRVSVSAQTPRAKRIGLLLLTSPSDPLTVESWRGFFAEMRRLGWEEGRNLVVERRFAMKDLRRHYPNAEELVAAGVDVIYAVGNERLASAYAATKSVPIVAMATGMVELGYAKSLALPGGNVTGLEFQALDFASKHFELMFAMQGSVKKIGYSAAHGTPRTDAYVKALQAAADAKGVRIVPLPNMLALADIEPMLAAATKEGVQVLALEAGMWFLLGQGVQRIQSWATANKVVTSSATWQRGDLLMSHGPDLKDAERVACSAIDRILRGARPQDIPIERPVRFELIINKKIAKEMGFAIPQSVLLQASEVID